VDAARGRAVSLGHAAQVARRARPAARGDEGEGRFVPGEPFWVGPPCKTRCAEFQQRPARRGLAKASRALALWLQPRFHTAVDCEATRKIPHYRLSQFSGSGDNAVHTFPSDDPCKRHPCRRALVLVVAMLCTHGASCME